MNGQEVPTGASTGFEPRDAVAVVTGAAGGIGTALVRALGTRGASVVVATDLDARHMAAVAEILDSELPATKVIGRGLDVTDAGATEALVAHVEADHGAIDLFCANAGVGTAAGIDAPVAMWQQAWEVNVMAHVHAAAAMVPRWSSRNGGHLLVTASAAGLLSNLGDAPYSATKHAAVAFAEWVAITHGHEGVGVSCLCPQGVRTAMVLGAEADEFASLRAGDRGAQGDAAGGDGDPGSESAPGGGEIDREHALAIQVVREQGLLDPADVAEAALDALAEGRFLALPHPEVATYERARAGDHDRWITGMQRLQHQIDAAAASPGEPS